MKTLEFFNDAAATWDQRVKHDENKIKQLLRKVTVRPEYNILDVGTGTGVLIPFLLKLIGKDGLVVAVDISTKMIEKAQQKFTDPRVTFLVTDIEQEPLPAYTFDVVFCYSVFPHFSEPEKALKKIYDLLIPEGKLVVMHSDSRETINNRHRNIGGPVGGHELPSVAKLQDLALCLGFQTMLAEETAEYYFLCLTKSPPN